MDRSHDSLGLIDPASHIHPNAKVGSGVRVGPGAVVDEHVEIGDGCEIRANAVITGHTRLGRNNQVGFGAVIGAEPQDKAFEPCVSFVEIGDDNIIREHVTIHRGTKPDTVTRVGNGAFLMAGAHLAHNALVEDGAILANNALLAGYVEVGKHAFISGNTVIHQFCRVGRLGMLRGGGRISKDIPPFMIGDATNRLMGLNTVGLRRAGIGREGRDHLKRLFRHLFFSRRNLTEALSSVEEDAEFQGVPEVAEVMEFIRTTKKGILFPTGKRDAAEDE